MGVVFNILTPPSSRKSHPIELKEEGANRSFIQTSILDVSTVLSVRLATSRSRAIPLLLDTAGALLLAFSKAHREHVVDVEMALKISHSWWEEDLDMGEIRL